MQCIARLHEAVAATAAAAAASGGCSGCNGGRAFVPVTCCAALFTLRIFAMRASSNLVFGEACSSALDPKIVSLFHKIISLGLVSF